MLNAALKAEISTLTLQEKLEVFEVIRNSVMPASDKKFSELSPQQEQELLRRAAHAAANPTAGRSWAEVRKHLED